MSTFNKKHTAIKNRSFLAPFILYSGSPFLVFYWGMFFFHFFCPSPAIKIMVLSPSKNWPPLLLHSAAAAMHAALHCLVLHSTAC